MSEEEKILESKISGVIVYQQGAQIQETGEINLQQGEHIVKITEISENVDKESIRVKGTGNGKIVNISIEFNSRKELKKEAHGQIKKDLEEKSRTLARKKIEISRLNEILEKFKLTESNFYSLWAKAYAFDEGNMQDFSEFNESITSSIEGNFQRREELSEEIKDLQNTIQVIRNKLQMLGPIEEIFNFYEIFINVYAEQSGDFTFDVRYTMENAWYEPFYDVIIEEDSAELTMMANVYNNTGIDWEGIDLEISTATLQPIKLIKPDPMILHHYSTITSKKRSDLGGAVPRGLKTKPMKMMEKKKDKAEKEIDFEPKPEIDHSYASISENIGIQSFRIPNKVSIPSDENPHPVNLHQLSLETSKNYYWSSIAPENVIIQDELTNGDLLLLPGNVKIYYKEEFLGETNINLIAPKEDFKLGTRVSYDLKIEKKLMDRYKSKKAIKGKLRNGYEYKIVIKNLNNVDEELVIYDRIPHSTSEKIDVEIEEIQPDPDKQELGILKYKIPMKGVKEKEIRYKYYVEYKKDVEITPPLP